VYEFAGRSRSEIRIFWLPSAPSSGQRALREDLVESRSDDLPMRPGTRMWTFVVVVVLQTSHTMLVRARHRIAIKTATTFRSLVLHHDYGIMGILSMKILIGFAAWV
jgi:hypothetical protein